MAAGQGFKTFTTGEVLTAADTNGYLMQGVLVFADAANRDAEITSPQEGQFAYLKDTNVTTYYTGSAWANLDTTGMTNPMTTTGDTIYSSSGSTPARLGIGSTGQVLTVAGGVPTWATAVSGSLTLLSTTTLSGATTTVSGISGSYTNLLVVVNGITNASTNYTLRIAPNGVTNIVSATGIQQTSVLSTTNGQILPTFSQNITNTPADNGLALIIYRYASSITNKPFTGSMGFNEATGGTNVASVISGAIRTTSAISSLVFTPSGGTFSAGTVLVYGVN